MANQKKGISLWSPFINRVTGSDGEMVQEESGNTKMSEENVVAKLQVASLIFDHLPSY